VRSLFVAENHNKACSKCDDNDDDKYKALEEFFAACLHRLSTKAWYGCEGCRRAYQIFKSTTVQVCHHLYSMLEEEQYGYIHKSNEELYVL